METQLVTRVAVYMQSLICWRHVIEQGAGGGVAP